MVLPTDKSGKNCVVDLGTYERLGEEDTRDDPEVSWEEVRASQRTIKGHMRCVNHIFKMGEDQGEKGEKRVWNAKELESTVIPIVSLLVKDHKNPKQNGDPATRPVCGASRSINGEMSESVSDILDAAGNRSSRDEAISTEEMLSNIDDLTKKLEVTPEPEHGMFVGSLDAVALYPSIEVRDASQLVAKRVAESKLIFDGVNWRRATTYVALNNT